MDLTFLHTAVCSQFKIIYLLQNITITFSLITTIHFMFPFQYILRSIYFLLQSSKQNHQHKTEVIVSAVEVSRFLSFLSLPDFHVLQ